jgi:hypothetical protein
MGTEKNVFKLDMKFMKIRNQKTVFYLLSIFYFSLQGVLSCVATHSSFRYDSSGESEVISPRIIFLDYSIKLDKLKGEPEIKLINKVITNGKLKINRSYSEIPKPGDLMCVSINTQIEPVDSILISDPLNITVESVNENNAFFKKEIALDSNHFSIRMQLTEKTDAIAIRKRTKPENQNSYLLITKIK